MKVFLNTSPLLRPKAGIGYYVQNIFDRLNQDPEITIIASHSPVGVRLGRFTTLLSSFPRRVFGEYYPTKIAGCFYDLLLSPFSYSSQGKITNKVSVDADIYHETTHDVIPGILESGKDVKFIADIHDLSPLVGPQWHLPEGVVDFARSFDKLINADVIITKSWFVANELVERFSLPQEKIRVVPNAPAALYRRVVAPASMRELIHKRIPTYSGKPFILYTGTIEPRKNLETLINAFTNLHKRYEVDLIIAGGFGWKYHELLKMPVGLGRNKVIFTGYVTEEEMLALYNQAAIFVFPSWYEGFGMPPLEAMACGVPVIVSNAGSLPEVTADAALTFDPARPEELTYLMEKLLDSENLMEELGRKGMKRAGDFSWERIVADIRDIYKAVMGSTP